MFEAQTGDVDLQQKDIDGKGEIFVNSGVGNCGIKGRTSRPARVFPANTITVDFFGNAYYRSSPYKMATHNHVFSLSGDILKNELIGLYVVGTMSYLTKVFSYNDMGTWAKIKEQTITLPVSISGDVDLAYMESFIRELESVRVCELGKWLVASGLDDCRLTPSEQKSLDDWRGGKVETTVRKVTEIFDVSNTHCVFGEWVEGRPGKVPYVTASSCNNSVSSYIDYKDEFLDRGNAIVIGGKTFVVTYQSEDFFSNDSHNLVLHLKDTRHRSREVYLYLIAAINAAMRSKYSWGDSISYKKIQKDMIVVPVTSSGEIDLDFMASFVRAIIKRVIRGVVEWTDQEIAAAKKAQVPLPYNKSAMDEPEEGDWEGRMAAFEDSDA